MRSIALALLLTACGPDCYLELIEGSDDNHLGTVHPADQVAYRAHLGERDFDCGGTWIVNGLVGGSAELGTIDTCGHYTAPAVFPDGLVGVQIEAIFPGHVGCEGLYAGLTPAP
jgi:hypothetical protein